MSPQFTTDDVGKVVESAAGDPLGTVTDVDDETAYVDPAGDDSQSETDSSAAGDRPDEAVPLADSSVEQVDEDSVRLSAEFPEESLSPGSMDEEEVTDPPSSDATGGAADQGRGIGLDDEGATDDGVPDADEPVPGADDHGGVTDEVSDTSEVIDGEGERRDSGSVESPGRGDAGATESGTREDVDVDPEELVEGDPEAAVEANEDVGQRSTNDDRGSRSDRRPADRGGAESTESESE